MSSLDVAVIGAGPFGLSVAAHLQHRRVRVFGSPMQTWQTKMPPDMLLRSAWAETSLSAPRDAGLITEWARTADTEPRGPLPLQTFLTYADWFRAQFVGDLDPNDVARLEPSDTGFVLVTTAGDEVRASRVVIAVGVTPFPHVPAELQPMLGHPALKIPIDVDGATALEGRRVIVIGGGQAAVESASLAIEAGASVELLARSTIHWFADREPDRERGWLGERLYRLAYPVVGYGPPPVNRIVMHPELFERMPASLRSGLTARLLRPGGSAWLRNLIEKHATLTEGVSVTAVTERGEQLELSLDDGTSRTADLVIIATGYRFDLGQLKFLDGGLATTVRLASGWPILDSHFCSTNRGLLFVGYPAEYRFGPLSRFVLGARFTAHRVATELAG